MNHPSSPATPTQMAHAIRFLAMDAVEAAKSGHPGAPMGMAEMAVALWARHLKHNPSQPHWPDRDRFVLSNGHGSMLIYALLHLSGYDLPLEELKKFRQLHSKTAGHPEYGITPGVETTTGPLGQGIANAVGMALAEKLLALEFNTPEHALVDHYTYAFLGDGCLMEGISHEVCSLAGTLGLSKLIFLYDDNGISIDGDVQGWFTDDTAKRFEAYGWNVTKVDGHDVDAVSAAIQAAKAQALAADAKPTLIACRTVIGKGAPHKQGGHDVHGAPLGAAEIAAARASLNWPYAAFEIPQSIYAAWDAKERGAQQQAKWEQIYADYAAQYPEKAQEFTRRMRGALPQAWSETLPKIYAAIAAHAQPMATRKASQMALDALAPLLPEFLGGSADLTSSNLTNFKTSVSLKPQQWGNYISYGVREFGMAAMMNGVALHGGYLPYGGTFLTFSDYSRNAIRMAALMKLRLVHVFTHDSIGLGEDGPTHQSIEHIPSLRLIPNLDVWRPADALETAVAWAQSVQRLDGPSALALTRQNVSSLGQDSARAEQIARGAYVLAQAPQAKAQIIATGSEVEIALAAHHALLEQGIATRVISMPCTQAFERQSADYRQAVVADNLPTVALEAAQMDGWYKYVGRNGKVIGMHTYGESAPAPILYQHFGITSAAVVQAVEELVR